MDSLDDGQTDLETKEDPPALFTGPTHIPSYTKISGNIYNKNGLNYFMNKVQNVRKSWQVLKTSV